MSDLAQRLGIALAAVPSEAPLEGDHPELRANATKEAAVLIAITERDAPGVLLTVRREHLRTHAGQIAFPGGRVEPDEDAVSAALREAHEEILLDPAAVDLVGTLDPYRTVTGYIVTPVIGVIPPDLPLEPHDADSAHAALTESRSWAAPGDLRGKPANSVGGAVIRGTPLRPPRFAANRRRALDRSVTPHA